MGHWEDYRQCCRAVAAEDRSAVFCPECAHPLFRCAAAGCGALVTPLGHCPTCIDLRLSIEQGAALAALAGECLSLPFALRNDGARSVSIRCVMRDVTSAAQQPVPLDWERLDAGQLRTFRVDAGPFEHGGVNNVKVTIVAAATLDDIEETYVFSGGVVIDVEGPQPTKVFQRIHSSGTGSMVMSRPDDFKATAGKKRAGLLDSRAQVPLERAERYEIEHGYRGYEESGARVPRNAGFVYAGFPPGDAPLDGSLPQRTLIRCGRNGRARDGRHDAQPNDLCLRIYDAETGALDKAASGAISRHACDFLLANDRLYVRATSETGVAVNGQRLPAAAPRVVSDGDSFALPAAADRQVTFDAAFAVSGGLVRQIRFERSSCPRSTRL